MRTFRNDSLPLRGVIFDLDGTLADTLPVCFAAFRAVFLRYVPERTFTDAEIADLFGPNEEGVIRNIVPQIFWDEALVLFLEAYATAHDACPNPFPGIKAALDLLREKGVPIAVVTGKGAKSAALSLKRLGLAGRFDTVEAGAPEGGIKPQAIRKVLDAWDVPTGAYAEIAYLGDATTDITAAREVGVTPLAAAWATTADVEALEALNPAATFRFVTEFAQWIGDRLATASPEMQPPIPDWLRWTRQMQAIAQNGLAYAKDPFDKERYEALRALSVEVVAAHASVPHTEVAALFAGETGYATPKIDVRGAIFRDNADGVAELLLVKEKSDGAWTLPGGWVDIGESPSEAVEKEVREEAGLNVKAVKVLGVLDRDKHGYPTLAVHVWKIFLLCEVVEGTGILTTTGDGLETEDAAFFREDAIPPLSLTRVVPHQIARLFEHRRHPDLPTDFD